MARKQLWTHALVTGASSGIGEAFVEALARRGAGLTIVARSEDRLADLALSLRERHTSRVEVLAADLTDAAELARVEARIRGGDPPVDLLVNAAGAGTSGRFHELDLDREEALIRLGVTAVVRLTHAAVPGMVERGHGGILNVSSLAGFQPMPTMATYGATRTFVTSFTEAVHEELRGSGVHVSVLCPGPTRTRFQERAGVEAAASLIPGPFWEDPEDVAAAGLAGLGANHAVVVPGLVHRATGKLARLLPTALTRRAVALGVRIAP